MPPPREHRVHRAPRAASWSWTAAAFVLAAASCHRPAGPPAAAPAPGDRAATARPTEGLASYYSSHLDGRRTASGERYDPTSYTAAHPTAPFGTCLRVTRLDDGRHVDVRVNDRGPFTAGRVIDLSRAAARELGILRAGLAHVRVEPCT